MVSPRRDYSAFWLPLRGVWLAAVLVLSGSVLIQRVAASECHPPPGGLVGWWWGDGDANDLNGANHGTLRGEATATVAGLVGSAFYFNSSDSHVEIPDSPILRPAILTLEAWVNFASLDSTNTGGTLPGRRRCIIFKQNSQSTNSGSFSLGSARSAAGEVFTFAVSSASGEVVEIQSSTVVTTGVWYHVAAVRGPDFVELYVGGQLESRTNVAFVQTYGDFPICFGNWAHPEPGYEFNGMLDEVSLYDRVLSAGEIGAIRNAGTSGKCKAPSIIAQPQSQTLLVGAGWQFTLEVLGAEPLNYQWYFNDSPIPGGVDASLQLTQVGLEDAGVYTVVVTNSWGSVTSAVAVLTVQWPPTITSQPQSQTNAGGTTTAFTCVVEGRAPLGFFWHRDGVTLADGARISGAASSTLTIANLRLSDAGSYFLVVSNADGVAVSDTARLGSLRLLTNLSLRNLGIESVAFLEGLGQLKWLNLERNRIRDISPLAGMTELNYPNLRWNQTTNYDETLSSLTNLSILYFGGNSISNISFLENLSQLTFLNLSENAINELSPMVGLTNLTYLVLTGNPITNCTLLSGLSGLVDLELRGNWLNDLTFFTNFNRLSYLDVAHNGIANLSPLASLTNLASLVLAGNGDAGFTNLSLMSYVSNLWLDGNSINDATFLAKMTKVFAKIGDRRFGQKGMRRFC